MSLNLTIPQADEQLKPRITVIGVGGAGGNAVTNMINSSLEGVEFLVCNTDAQALAGSPCQRKIQLGRQLTRGLGAGARPDVGRAAAEEAMDEILGTLDGCNMVFITAGMGGGTGTGAAPVIARSAREQGILTVGVITKPFHFEGVHRMRLAEAGIAELTQHVDTLIIIPNQNLFRVANEKTTFADAFKMADDVLESGVRGVTDLMVLPGLINLDFNDIRTVMTEMGKAMMGTGEADGEDRAIKAAEAAIANPLLDDVSMRGARGVLINITGGPDLTLFEVDEAANKIREQVDPEANIIFGSCLDDKLQGRMRVSIVATGIDAQSQQGLTRAAAPSLSLIASERDRRRTTSQPAAQPIAASVAAAPVVHEALRAQPVTLSAAAPAYQPQMQPQAYAAPAPQAYAASAPQAYAAPAPQPAVAEPVREYRPMALDLAEEEPAAPDVLPESEPLAIEEMETHDQHHYVQVAEPDPTFFQQPEAAAESWSAQTPDAESFVEQIEQSREAFVAPTPMVAQRDEPAVTEPVVRPDPYREAELANATRPSEAPAAPRRAPSLISKVTGLGRLLGGGQSQSERRVEPPLARSAQPQQPPAQPARQQPAAARPAAAQPRLNLDQSERRQGGTAEEQLLDIPAFLRRQAN